MEILDNARIIRELTDKENEWGVWHFISEKIKWLEQAEKKVACINKGKVCADCNEWERCRVTSNILLSFSEEENRYWDNLIEQLNFDSLYSWLIDEPNTQEELQFRLKKIKSIIGSMWSKDDWVNIWCLLNGFKPTSELTVGKNWEITKGIIPTKSLSKRFFDAAVQLDKTLSEDDIDNRVADLMSFMLDNFVAVGSIVLQTNLILEEAESILNPQPDTSETETEDPIFSRFDLFRHTEIKSIFKELIKKEIISIDNGYFRWQLHRQLLLYFCREISTLYNLSKDKTNPDDVSWISFDEMFICNVWDKLTLQKNKDLRGAWQDYKKASKNYNKGDGTLLPPKGWGQIEDAISIYFKP